MLSAEAEDLGGKKKQGLDNSRYDAKTESDNYLWWIFRSACKDDVRLENVVLDQFISQLFECVIF